MLHNLLWFVGIPLCTAVVLCAKFPKRIIVLPFIALVLSIGLEYLFCPFHITDIIFGADPNDDFAFTTGFWVMTEIFVYIPWCFIWVLGCKAFLERKKIIEWSRRLFSRLKTERGQ